MKAVKFYGIGQVGTVEDAPVPDLEGQVVVQVLYGGICGSDLHIYREGMFVETLGETMGHEFVGRVHRVPQGCNLNVGDLVVGDPRVTCGQCPSCRAGDGHRCGTLGFIGEVRHGCFGTYMTLEAEKLIPLPSETDPKQGALAEPLAVAVHACHRIVDGNTPPDRVLVVGGGPIGLLITYLLKKRYHIACVDVADRDEFRISMASVAGADGTFRDAAESQGGYHCTVDAVGVEGALKGALLATAPGGKICISAIYEKLPVVDVNYLVANEQQLVGNNAYRFEDLKEAAELIGGGELDFGWLVTRILPAEQAADAFALLVSPEKKDLKILLDFGAK